MGEGSALVEATLIRLAELCVELAVLVFKITDAFYSAIKNVDVLEYGDHHDVFDISVVKHGRSSKKDRILSRDASSFLPKHSQRKGMNTSSYATRLPTSRPSCQDVFFGRLRSARGRPSTVFHLILFKS